MIYTSYFGNIKRICKAYPEICFISIAGKTPKWFFDIPKCFSYKILAPKFVWWKEWHDKFSQDLESAESKEWYKTKYVKTVLLKLNCFAICNELNRISCGSDICLLCYETPDKFCHRQLVGEWLEANNIQCNELIGI